VNPALTQSDTTASDDDVLTPVVSSALANPIEPVAFANAATVSAGLIPGQGGEPPLKVATAGSGLVFLDTFTKVDSAPFESAVVTAEKQLEGLFTNNVTISLEFTESNTANDPDGSALPSNVTPPTYSYATLKAALLKLAPNDIFPATDPSGGKGFTIPPAYAHMLGLSTAAPTLDGIVTFGSKFAWNFGQDVVDAVTHAISEIGMGRVSGLGVANNGIWTPLDLFRYTASGVYDPTDGRGDPAAGIAPNTADFFSSDGGVQTSAGANLAFTNQFDSPTNESDANADPDDWRQGDTVFGNPAIAGSTATLLPTELNVMSALGWTLSLKQQVFTASSGDWENPSNWIDGYNPISAEDAALGNGAAATLSDTVTVNSISLGASSTLIVENGGSLIATNGTTANAADADIIYSGNDGTIEVGVSASITLSGAVENLGTLALGAQVTNASGAGVLSLRGATTFFGGGAIDLGEIAVGVVADIAAAGGGGGGGGGHIVTDVTTGDISSQSALVNVDNTMSGAGIISAASFDNQARASAGASIASNALQIRSAEIANEGELFANSASTLTLGEDGASVALANSGQIDIAAGAHLSIAGNLTAALPATLPPPVAVDVAVAGSPTAAVSGSIELSGAGGALVSDDFGATTFTNAEAIVASASAQIGDAGLMPANDLTLVNTGSIVAEGSSAALTLNTGADNIVDRGGLIEAELGAQLTIDSGMQTGQFNPGGVSPPPQSTIEAASGGVVDVDATIFDGAKFANNLNGRILVDGGTVDVAANVLLGVPVTFTGAGGALDLADTPADVEVGGANGAINLFDANADVTGSGFTVAETGTEWLAIGGNGFAGAADVVEGTGQTITTHSGSNVTVAGSHDRIDVGVGNDVTLQGSNEALSMRQLFGEETLNGFAASDVMNISASDFASFQDLLGHATQTGANTTITLDAHDAIELTNVARASLSASQFSFT